MMQERGVEVDASTIFRWVQRTPPELEKRVRSRLPFEVLARGRADGGTIRCSHLIY